MPGQENGPANEMIISSDIAKRIFCGRNRRKTELRELGPPLSHESGFSNPAIAICRGAFNRSSSARQQQQPDYYGIPVATAAACKCADHPPVWPPPGAHEHKRPLHLTAALAITVATSITLVDFCGFH